MAFVYRIEKKKILRNQQHLIQYFKALLKQTENALRPPDGSESIY